MKSFRIIITLVIIASVSNLFAQEKGTSNIKVGYGYATSTQMITDFGQIFGTVFTLGNITYVNETTTGAIFVGYDYSVSDKFTVGTAFAYEKIDNDVKSGDNIIGTSENTFYTIAIASQFHYVSKEKLQMYSGLGLAYSFGTSSYKSSTPDEENSNTNANMFNFQITGFGIRYGNTVGAFAEVGYGYRGIINAGVSFNL